LSLKVYKATASFPRTEVYGLAGQSLGTCVSIPARIAGGCGRSRDSELVRFLQIAMGSGRELGNDLLLKVTSA